MKAQSFVFNFRPLEDGDLRKLHAWLNDPAVVEWWEGRDVSWEAVVRDYGSARTGSIEHWLAIHDGAPLGWIQCYCAKSEEEDETYYWSDHVDLERTGGIDYLVGGSNHRGRGIGSAMIRAFVRDIAFARHPDWDNTAAAPFEANAPSCRALEKAGFQKRATLNDPDGPCALMVIERSTLEGSRAEPSG